MVVDVLVIFVAVVFVLAHIRILEAIVADVEALKNRVSSLEKSPEPPSPPSAA